ncbi:MAG: hypothetical protein EBR17_08405 [Betaproteobacteria bacterium]|jgi:hypothetical protein|nr:hypothetical protein [Burkholderiales bacterium]NBX15137.1 hypothetical protein [Betaproteobacteria bacterium]NBX90097.1 hypothetical protein [Betaproteobacteria bacterium]
MNLSYTARQFLTLPALIWVCLSAQAGRPLTVDDANVNDTGVAHVETFWSRGADGARVLTIAPTYSPLPGLDLIAQDARTLSGGPHSQTIQTKLQLSQPRENGCHTALVFGATHWQKGQGQSGFMSANLSCDLAPGALHWSLVSSRSPQGADVPSLGVAWEHVMGSWTGHVESVAQRQAKPMLGVGLRRDILPGLQLDGTWGRMGGQTLFSLGSKWQF